MFSYLTADEIDEIVTAAIAVGLTDGGSRTILFSQINPTYWMTLMIVPVPRNQLLLDLTSMNGIERLADGTVPLAQWLRRASAQAAGRVEQAIFQRYLAQVEQRSAGAPPIPNPQLLPEVVEQEAILFEDDMVDIGFLRAGARAGAAVAKLVVPQFEGGKPRPNAQGQPGIFLGTGWLVTPQLLMTNRHVVRARVSGDPEPAAADIALQVAGTTVKFDFDGAGSAGTDAAVASLEASDSVTELDFAVLRLTVPQDRDPLQLFTDPVPFAPGASLPVNVIQHPDGQPKRDAFSNNLESAVDDTTVRYFTDTNNGSSGAPVFDDDWRVVALHRGSVRVQGVNFQGRSTAVINIGSQMAAILAKIKAANPPLWEEIAAGA